MKIAKSQDGRQAFMMDGNYYISIAPVEVDAKAKVKPFSLGVGNQSVGIYKTEQRAKQALEDFVTFLAGKDAIYTVPADD